MYTQRDYQSCTRCNYCCIMLFTRVFTVHSLPYIILAKTVSTFRRDHFFVESNLCFLTSQANNLLNKVTINITRSL